MSRQTINTMTEPDLPEPVPATSQSRRKLLGRAALGLASVGAASAIIGCGDDEAGAKESPATGSGDSPRRVLSFLATQEGFGVTFLTEAIRRAPGTPSEEFLGVLKAANVAEFDHLRALQRIGGRPETSRYWIPDAAFGGNDATLFASIDAVETIEISLYLVGVTTFTQSRNAARTRLCAEALGTEAEHRVLARAAEAMLTKTAKPAPNNVSFEAYDQRSVAAAKAALEKLGIGYGKKSSMPGKFYEFPGNPLPAGEPSPVSSRVPR